MERKLINGEYVPNGAGGLTTLEGAQEVLARVLFRLTARRGGLPFRPNLGSRLYQVLREKPSARQALAAQYAAEALEEETDLKLSRVEWQDTENGGRVVVRLEWRGETLTAQVDL
ncbi:hypothetical protein DWX58_04480 [Pseudoflavonifractor sp. AF19-9AC]|uniref:hypothetical protein n=1 Tax=Pseudoflavonifractor sp. AF19-9AC TaxID=2292244 RepID=UPI000E4794F1|nr:hypothetical protein [Pseudoflavonifractor sp. AF19-9AC]RHR10648.1 hypothetical protein DWX58_04480 [Pseudoflavonifractor sp. AF19-9AC]